MVWTQPGCSSFGLLIVFGLVSEATRLSKSRTRQRRSAEPRSESAGLPGETKVSPKGHPRPKGLVWFPGVENRPVLRVDSQRADDDTKGVEERPVLRDVVAVTDLATAGLGPAGEGAVAVGTAGVLERYAVEEGGTGFAAAVATAWGAGLLG